jgi:hypothetical protein
MGIKLCAVVCTYNRPHMLPRSILCFEQQDYPAKDRRMLIYDDAGQYRCQSGDDGRWQLVSDPARAPSLGAKRNSAIVIAANYFSGIEAVLPIDDDDLFLPWHFSASAAALARADWSRPSQVLAPVRGESPGVFQANYTGHRDDQTKERLYHPAWAFRLFAYWAAGRYPDGLSGPEDQGLMRGMETAGTTQADPIELGFRPSYIYDWGHGNISGMLNARDRTGEQAWSRLGEARPQPTELGRWAPPFDLHHPAILHGVLPRPF